MVGSEGYKGVATFPAAVDNQAAIEAVVSDILREMAPDVVRIRFDFHDDRAGDPGVFFRVCSRMNWTGSASLKSRGACGTPSEGEQAAAISACAYSGIESAGIGDSAV